MTKSINTTALALALGAALGVSMAPLTEEQTLLPKCGSWQ